MKRIRFVIVFGFLLLIAICGYYVKIRFYDPIHPLESATKQVKEITDKDGNQWYEPQSLPWGSYH